jgi:hypothetical protein
MSEINMKSEGQPNLVKTSEQKRDEAIDNFIRPENKPRIKQKNWLRRNLGRLLTVGGLIATAGVGVGIYESTKSHEPTPIASTFDVSALNSKIGIEDSVQMTFDDYVASAPPVWVEENRTMTVPVPILFKDNRTPTLSIKKIESQFDGRLNVMSIDGLEQGDTVVSLIDGEIEITQGHEKDLAIFTLYTQDSQGNDIDIMYLTNGLEPDPSISFEKPIKNLIRIPIKKGQPIGKMLTSDSLELIGAGPLLQNFNLAVTPENKAILLK